MVTQKTPWLILIFLLLAGFFVRLVNLTGNPPALNWDEVSHGVNAYSLWQTGRDQWGQLFPVLNYRSYGDYPAVLDTYLTVPAFALLGTNDLSLRFPHALAGTLVILLVFIAAYRFFHHSYPALIVSLLTAFDPWSFFPSRAVFQSNFAVLFLSLGLALYLSRRRTWAILIWAASLLAYHNTRIFIPLFLVTLLPGFKFRPKLFLLAAGTVLISFIILFLPGVRARGSWISIVDSGAIAQIEGLRNQSRFSPLLTSLFYNRPVYFLNVFVKNYVHYFSPGFLFFHGGTQYQYSQPGFGVLNWAELPFFYLGIWYFLRHKHKLFLAWLILAPLPAAITRDQFAVIRATCMLPVVYFFSAAGLWWTYAFLKKSGLASLLIIVAGVYLGFTLVYLNSYFFIYPRKYSQSWQYGYSQLFAYLLPRVNQYDRIIITKKYAEPHEFLFWYSRWDPADFQNNPGLVWDFHDNWYWINAVGKFTFVNDWELSGFVRSLPQSGRTLVVASGDSKTDSSAQIYQINFLDGRPAFFVEQI
jgi:4-amino-4-deoxy-L-arabinose transferase-like glycosyltransferase